MMRTPDATTQLMQLRQAKVIGPLNDDGIGGRYVDTGFDNGGTDQHVETLMVEIVHHTFQITLTHLTMANSDTRFRHQFAETLRRFLDIFNVIVEVVDLSATQNLTQDRFADHQIVKFTDKRFHR